MDQKWSANGGDTIGGAAHSVGPVKKIFDANEDFAELGYRSREKQIYNDVATERQCVRIVFKLLADVPSNDRSIDPVRVLVPDNECDTVFWDLRQAESFKTWLLRSSYDSCVEKNVRCKNAP